MKRRALGSIFCLLFATFFILPGCLIETKQSQQRDAAMVDLQRQVNELKTANQELAQRFDDSARVSGEAVLGFQSLQNEVSVLQGRFDEVARNNQLSRQELESMRRQLARELNKINKRLATTEKELGIKYVDTGDEQRLITERDSFNQAMALYNQGNLEAAKAKFRDFIGTYPKSKVLDEARFYLAESHFKQKNWEEAILTFDTLITRYPKSKFVPTAYLRMGVAFYENGQINDARLFYEKVIELYPRTREAEIAKKKLKMMR